MKRIYFVIISCLILSAIPAQAKAVYFHDECPTLKKCIDYVGKLLDQKYIYSKDFNKTIQSTKNAEITKENAELLLTSALHDNKFTRVPLGQSNSFKIVDLLASPHEAVPTFSADAKHKPELPKVWDVVTIKYKAVDPQVALTMPNLIQDYLPGTGLITATQPGYVVITASAPEVTRIMNMLDAYDQKISPEMAKKLEAQYKLMRDGNNANSENK